MTAFPSILVRSVNVAPAQPMDIGGRQHMSGIRKRPIDGRARVGPLGLAGDEQADQSVHGGLSKAVYAYPVQHFAFWQTVRAQARVAAPDEPLEPGFAGENLTLEGISEADVWVGDRLRFDDCELAVSEPRFPCFKFNAVAGFPQASKLMGQSGWCGFYLAVTVPGTIGAGDRATLTPGPREVGIAELFRARMRRQRD